MKSVPYNDSVEREYVDLISILEIPPNPLPVTGNHIKYCGFKYQDGYDYFGQEVQKLEAQFIDNLDRWLLQASETEISSLLPNLHQTLESLNAILNDSFRNNKLTNWEYSANTLSATSEFSSTDYTLSINERSSLRAKGDIYIFYYQCLNIQQRSASRVVRKLSVLFGKYSIPNSETSSIAPSSLAVTLQFQVNDSIRPSAFNRVVSRLHSQLKTEGYIDSKTTLPEFRSLFKRTGSSVNESLPTIRWLKHYNALTYFEKNLQGWFIQSTGIYETGHTRFTNQDGKPLTEGKIRFDKAPVDNIRESLDHIITTSRALLITDK